MKNMWLLDLDTVIEIFELAKKHGKKEGDNIQAEFDEIMKKYPDKFKYLGNTNKDIDLLTGDLREKGLKILNLNEEKRKRKRNEK